MEKHEFMPRSAPPAEGAHRDLPPNGQCPLTPAPRMERPVEQDGGAGCGCGHPDGNQGGGCVGFEGCGAGSWGLGGHPLAMVYAPCQGYHALYDPATALSRGTLFTELDLPLGGDCVSFSTVGCACRAERRGV